MAIEDQSSGQAATTEPARDNKASFMAATQSDGWKTIAEASERVREAQLEVEQLIERRNDAIKSGVDLYHFSYRQAARASGLTTGRIHGILANQ